jgi:signal transduction histidine kinase
MQTQISGASCLAGGGEMGALMRSVDWSRTPFGDVSSWPQSLRTTVSIMLESRFAMVVAWGPEFRFLYNDRYRPVLGAKHPASLGMPGAEIFPEVWPDLVGPEFERVRRGEAFAIDDWLLPLDRNGYLENCWFTVSYSPIRDESGDVGGVLAVVAETTGRVEGERRLATLRDLARRAADAKTVEQAFTNAAGVLRLNPVDVPFALLYLLDAHGTIAERVCSVGIAPEHAASVARVDLSRETQVRWPFADCLASGEPLVVDDLPARFGSLPGGAFEEPAHTAVLLPLTRPGLPHPYGILVAGVSARRALDDGYRGFYELAADHIATAINNARTLEDAQRRAEALAEIDRAKTTFFSNVSHEFRTPLTLMLGPTEDLLSGTYGALPAAQRDQVELLHRNALRLLKLVNALLDFSRIEAGRVEAVFEPTDLTQLTIDLASAFRSAIERARLQFEVSCLPLDEAVYVDRSMWEKIVLNLLSNAFKFTLEGRIAIALRTVDDRVELTVSDTGTGIAPAELPHLFTRFHRIAGVRARTTEGSGIGLALVQELVRIHGGTIGVDSTPGAGTTFTVSLPTGRAHLPSDRIMARRALGSTSVGAAPFVAEASRWLTGADAEQPAMGDGLVALPHDGSPAASVAPSADLPSDRARILVVDDNADMREYLQRLLETRWHVELACDGVAALHVLRTRPPDLVIADVMMPELDGFQLLRAIRGEERLRALPVLVLSARAGEESRVEGVEAGADDYLVKPFSARELLARVQAQLEFARLRWAAELERTRLKSLFMEAPAPICIFRGPDHRYEFANPSYARLVGDRPLIGQPIREALPEIAGQGFYELLDRVYQTGETHYGTEVPARLSPSARASSEFFFNFVYQPMRDLTGAVEGVMVFAYDVTDEVLARRAIEASIQSRDGFFSAASHELRNPIQALQMQLLSVVRQMDAGDEQLDREFVKVRVGKASQQVARLVRLLNTLLDTSRIAAGRLDLEREHLDLAAVVGDVVERLEPETQGLFQVHLAPAQGYWDRVRLDQVVTNLISNAVKYGNGHPVDVWVRAERDTVALVVRDRGIGIAVEDQAKIFEQFERGHREPQYEGFGLGLWISHQIVRALGGTISLHSEVNVGSTFTVTLPYGPTATDSSNKSDQ